MSRNCISVSDAIWDFVREGIELTEDDLRHARSCNSCASTLAEAEACVAAFGCVRPFPAAPDCRSAVMSRISRQRTRSIPAWTYACAVLLVAVTIAGALFWPHGGRPASDQANRPSAIAGNISPEMPLPASEPKPEMRTAELEKPRAPQHLRLHQPTRHRHNVPPANTVAPTAPKPAKENPEPQVTPPTDGTCALAYVTWPTANQPRDSYQYRYTVADPATGEVTKCSVKRQGNTIEINMESEPPKPETKPAKESNTNEEAIRCG